jgi:uncharacterized protein (TIGR01370 family)
MGKAMCFRSRTILNAVIAATLFIAITTCKNTGNTMKFGIDYGKATPAEVTGYDLLILEPYNYSRQEVRALQNTQTKLIGYVSLGEVGTFRWYYPLLKDNGLTLAKNPNWNSYIIDLEDSLTTEVLLDKVIPEIIAKGFDGLFLDTVDNVAPGAGYSHMQDDMVGLIKEIRRRYPNIYIIQNRGMFLLDKTHQYISALLIEDVATMYDFDNKNYGLVEDHVYKKRVGNIAKYQNLMESDNILLVDYAKTNELQQEVKKRLDTLGLSYFISSIELDTLPPAEK